MERLHTGRTVFLLRSGLASRERPVHKLPYPSQLVPAHLLGRSHLSSPLTYPCTCLSRLPAH